MRSGPVLTLICTAAAPEALILVAIPAAITACAVLKRLAVRAHHGLTVRQVVFF
jgi:hypothetical protein